MSTRAQNENKFGQWDELPGGGRRYGLDVPGKLGWLARYLKEVDANETTLRFWQEIYDDQGKRVERVCSIPVSVFRPGWRGGESGEASGVASDHLGRGWRP